MGHPLRCGSFRATGKLGARESTLSEVRGSLTTLSVDSHTRGTFMTLTLLLLACGGSSPSVTVETGVHSEAPQPGQLADVLDAKIRRPIETCYKEAIKEEPGLEGTVRYEALGSHGILRTNVTAQGSDTLEACALTPMADQRLLRVLADGDNTVGFTVVVNFSGG